MARKEKDSPMKQELEVMKGDVMKAVKKRSKSRNPLVTCLVIFTAAVIVFLVWLAWTVASTGLVTVPVFSSLAYRAPEPSREVVAGEDVQTLFASQVQSQMVRAVTSGQADPLISVDLPESALTTGLRSAVIDGARSQFVADASQIVVLEGRGLEVFLPLQDNAQASALVLMIDFQTKDQELTAEIQSVRLGSWRMPGWMTASFIQPLVDSAMREAQNQLSARASLQSVSYGDGVLTLLLAPSESAMQELSL